MGQTDVDMLLASSLLMKAKFTEVVGGTVGGTPVITHGVNELSR